MKDRKQIPLKTQIAILLLLSISAVLFGLALGLTLWGQDAFEGQVYYDIPSGGYIYKDNYDGSPGYCLRYNHNSFNGTLDYQVTLNPRTLDGVNRY